MPELLNQVVVAVELEELEELEIHRQLAVALLVEGLELLVVLEMEEPQEEVEALAVVQAVVTGTAVMPEDVLPLAV